MSGDWGMLERSSGGSWWVGVANGSGAVARDIFAVYGFKLNLID